MPPASSSIRLILHSTSSRRIRCRPSSSRTYFYSANKATASHTVEVSKAQRRLCRCCRRAARRMPCPRRLVGAGDISADERTPPFCFNEESAELSARGTGQLSLGIAAPQVVIYDSASMARDAHRLVDSERRIETFTDHEYAVYHCDVASAARAHANALRYRFAHEAAISADTPACELPLDYRASADTPATLKLEFQARHRRHGAAEPRQKPRGAATPRTSIKTMPIVSHLRQLPAMPRQAGRAKSVLPSQPMPPPSATGRRSSSFFTYLRYFAQVRARHDCSYRRS